MEYDDDDNDADDIDDDYVGVGVREKGGKVERGIYAQQPPPLHL